MVLEAFELLAFSLFGFEYKSLPPGVLFLEALADFLADVFQVGDFKLHVVAGELHPLEQVLDIPLLSGLKIVVLPLFLLGCCCFVFGFLSWHFLSDTKCKNDSIHHLTEDRK
jgi:hypothetical protein